ncbi:MAG: hypothetical protein SCALA702_23870 [Melioribacteraceae bacterium]|nr:MAG: hypothetical protein SCALA702_23870 [Melioribacteraceae bacterium]
MSQISTSDFYNDYEKYKDNNISNRRFGHEVIEKLVEKLSLSDKVVIKKQGESLNGDSIYLISIGTGERSVLCWSQMHGDESTATMALFDIFNFLIADDRYNDFREELFNNVTLHFVPMLNPDGAEMFKRRNALDIDLNRDAARQQMPESKILAHLQDSLKPEYGFNLHDQSTYYTAGRSDASAMLSFLAPAFNFEKDMNAVREKTMEITGYIYNELQPYIPGHIGRYNDDYEPRAFGDYMIAHGTASTLVESGGWKDDEEKQFIRKMNFVTLLSGFNSISTEKHRGMGTDMYWSIPENERNLFDLVIREVYVEYRGNKYIIDIGIKRNEENTSDYKSKFYRGKIEDIGDLSIFHGYDELNGEGLTIKKGKVYPENFATLADLKKIDYISLLKDGYTTVVCDSLPDGEYVNLPLNVTRKKDELQGNIELDDDANLLLYNGEKLKYVIVNGFLFDLGTNKLNIYNGIIYK